MIDYYVTANVVEGWSVRKPYMKAGIGSKNPITLCIPLASEFMAAVLPEGPIPMLDNPSLQASYFVDWLHHAATKPYGQGHEARVEIPLPWVKIDARPFKGFKNAPSCSFPFSSLIGNGCCWLEPKYCHVRYRAPNAPMGSRSDLPRATGDVIR